MARKKDIIFEIEAPSGIEVSLNGREVTMKKDSKEQKIIIGRIIKVEKDGNKIIISAKNAGKDERREFGTAKSHLKNMIEGFEKGYEYELEICNVHFPMTVTFDKAKYEFIIKNLLGEKSPRTIKISSKVEVEIKAPVIRLKSYDLDLVGQAAANLEKVSRIRNRDRNKFQDGIFITKKPGRTFL
jgi:large subunit ribosomal protein L6